MRCLILNLTFLFSLCLSALAWGPGHDDIQRAILARLPNQFTTGLDEEFIRRLIQEYSHYPDSFDPFDVALIGPASLDRLRRNGISCLPMPWSRLSGRRHACCLTLSNGLVWTPWVHRFWRLL